MRNHRKHARPNLYSQNRLLLAFLLSLAPSAAATGCGEADSIAEPSGRPNSIATQEQDPEETAGALPNGVVAQQTFEIERDHTITIRRFDDDSIVLAEQGVIGQHHEALGNAPAGRSIPELMRIVAGEVEVLPALAAKLKPFSPYDEPAVEPPAIEPWSGDAETDSQIIAKSAPRTSLPAHTVDNIGWGVDPSPLLKCDSIELAQCLPNSISYASLDWDYGGYHRKFAINPNTTAATFRLLGPGLPEVVLQSIVIPAGNWAQFQYLPVKRSYARADLRNNFGNIGISSLVTSIGPRAQEKSNWCWAASAQMAMSQYGDPPEQCEFASKQWPSLGNCCAANADARCNGTAEAWQAFNSWGYSYNRYDMTTLTSITPIVRMLQFGPIVLHYPHHYTIVSDYKEIYENGSWVPYGFAINPEPWGNYDQTAHTAWVRLSSLSTANNANPNNGANAMYGSIESNGNTLDAHLTMTWWVPSSHFVYGEVHSKGADYFEYRLYNSGGASGNTTLWDSGTVRASQDSNDDSTRFNFDFDVGSWLWYDVRVRACKDSPADCGSWVSHRSVSREPITHIDSMTFSGGVLTAKLRANPAPAETTFRYRLKDTSTSPDVIIRSAATDHDTQSTVTLGRFDAKSTVSVRVPSGITARIQAQSCSFNGCSPWVAQSLSIP